MEKDNKKVSSNNSQENERNNVECGCFSIAFLIDIGKYLYLYNEHYFRGMSEYPILDYILNHPLVYITLNVLIFGAVIFLIDMFPNSKK